MSSKDYLAILISSRPHPPPPSASASSLSCPSPSLSLPPARTSRSSCQDEDQHSVFAATNTAAVHQEHDISEEVEEDVFTKWTRISCKVLAGDNFEKDLRDQIVFGICVAAYEDSWKRWTRFQLSEPIECRERDVLKILHLLQEKLSRVKELVVSNAIICLTCTSCGVVQRTEFTQVPCIPIAVHPLSSDNVVCSRCGNTAVHAISQPNLASVAPVLVVDVRGVKLSYANMEEFFIKSECRAVLMNIKVKTKTCLLLRMEEGIFYEFRAHKRKINTWKRVEDPNINHIEFVFLNKSRIS